MEPLAYKMRPLNINDVVGNKKTILIIKKMLEQDKVSSMIIYGPPGVGKTTLANIIAKKYANGKYVYNASTDNKAQLKDLIEGNGFFQSPIIVIDEIHRMKKDTQDFLLPYVESGKVTIIGLTTENPFYVVNKAIRSRVMLLELKFLNEEDIHELLTRAKSYLTECTIDDMAYHFIYKVSNGEARFALNLLENAYLFDKHITKEACEAFIDKINYSLDDDGDEYYKILSALHKSVRGSDVNAALHYTARLLEMGDIESLFRRLIAIAYEDISLANPQIGPRVIAAYEAFKILGYPEGLNPLATIICDMALSPKSNSANIALNAAIEDYKTNNASDIPNHLNNNLLKAHKANYKFPHDFKGGWVKQQYLPDSLKDHTYYTPKDTSSYEKALKERYEIIMKKNE